MRKHVTYRLPEEVIEDIRYLTFLMNMSPARVITFWMDAIAHAVDIRAGTRAPARENAEQLLRNGGTFLTLEEQQAVVALRNAVTNFGQQNASILSRNAER